MSSEAAIEVIGIGKAYQIYKRPEHRLKQMFGSLLARTFGCRPPIYYTEHWALRDISFNVLRGETVGIIGRNGSGKSTLLQIICGTLQPTMGRVVTRGRIAALLELGAGFNPEFTGRENSILNAQILGLSAQEIAERINEIEAFADIGEFFDRPLKTYSSGMNVRVAFAVQACVEPDILIVDEALAVGDAPFQAKCMKRLEKLKKQGTSILFVSHDASTVRTLCDRAIWIDRGGLRLAGAVVPITSSYLESVFLKEEETRPVEFDDTTAVRLEPSDLGIAAKPISHWGTHLGLIRDIELLDAEGRSTFLFEGYGVICIRLRVCLSEGVECDDFAVAIAIKTLAGVPLVVGVTRKQQLTAEAGRQTVEYQVEFELINLFNTGKYMIAAAVQRGDRFEVQYLEHIEGIAFFQSVQDADLLGLVLPQMTVRTTKMVNGIVELAA